jgi:hypothetical protein
MRLSRSLPFALAFLLAAAMLGNGVLTARAQSVDEAEDAASDAEQRAEVAAGLVDNAIAERSGIEAELAESMSRISELADELSRVSAGVERLREQVGFADTELSGIQEDIETGAVDAYMTALSAPGVNFVNSSDVEDVMVTGLFVEDLIDSGRSQIDQLIIKRDDLEGLIASFEAEEVRVGELKAAVDAEVEHLAALYEEADSAVAAAIRDADRASAAYGDALSAVDAARAREAEEHRQEERPAPEPTTPEPTVDSTTTTRPDPTTTEDEGSGGGGGGPRDFPAAVERWRDEVSAYFPASRVDEALAVLQCESLGDPEAYNPYTGASGLFQFLPATWAATAPKAGFSGAQAFDPVANIGTAAWLGSRYEALGKGFWKPWSCRRVLN